MAGRKPHEPTKASRQLVELHSTIGTPQNVIASLLEINQTTLVKYYRKELDQASHKANAQVGGALFKKAVGGDTTAMIFWMKTRARWRENEIQDPSGQPITSIKVEVIGANQADSDTTAG